ncbi:MAG: DNA repair exonuclease [Chromatiaceae bacterium]|nr:DNA repair exonuclease [Chromatiaceae bacterium]
MRFIHAADIHLDSPLTGLSAYPDAPADRLRTVTREAFGRLVDLALEEAVDFMVIAGDLYDGNWKDANTGHYFCREMGRLNRAGIPVYLLHGNHDAESEMTRKLTLPDNVHTFESRKASSFRLDTLKVALHGRGYREAATLENLAASYPPPVAGWLNIGVLHTALEGYASHARYAPCSLAELTAKGYDYWALGHVHEFAILHRDPWVVFPGNLQGRHSRETGERGALLVTADEAGIKTVERLAVAVLRWERLELDVAADATLEEVVRRVGRAFEGLIATTPEHLYLAVRLVLRGQTAAHGELFGLAAHLREEVLGQAAAQGLDRLWVEKVCLETRPPRDAALLSARGDAIADLQAFLAAAPDDPDLLKALLDDLRPLVDKAPRELLAALPELEAIRQGEVADLIRAVTPDLLAHLGRAR